MSYRAADHLVPTQERLSRRLRANARSLGMQLAERELGTFAYAVQRAAQIPPGQHEPGTYRVLEHICRAVEFACEQLGYTIYIGDAPPAAGLGAANGDFFGARIAIPLVPFTDWLADRVVATLAFVGGTDGKRIRTDGDKCLDRIRADEVLRSEWERLFLHFAGLPLKSNAPASRFEKPIFTKQQRALKFQLTSAMEVFAVAREYGLHIARHRGGSTVSSPISREDAIRYEFEADEIAWAIAQFLGIRGFAGHVTNFRNSWMESSAGAIAFVASAEIVRRTREILQTGAHADDRSLAYPPTFERLRALDTWPGFAGEAMKDRFFHQRHLFSRLIPGIYNELKVRFWAAHRAGIRPTQRWSPDDESVAANNAAIDAINESIINSAIESISDFVVDAATARTGFNKTHIKASHDPENAELEIARDLLRQHRERTISHLAEHAVVSFTGTKSPLLTASVAERLRTGKAVESVSKFEDLIQAYCHWIEQICAKLNLPLHGGVAAGVIWNPMLGPAQKSVPTTTASMITIPESTLMLCHFICKLLVRSFSIKVEDKRLAISFAPDEVIAKIRASSKLRSYAAHSLAYCATWNRMYARRMKRIAGDARHVWMQLLMGTEIFVIAHEYAHHIEQHGIGDSVGVDGPPNEFAKAQELQADRLAALITAHFGVESSNNFAHSGASAVLALIGTDLVRRARSVLETSTEEQFASDTHPQLKDRLQVLETLSYDPRERDAVRNVRQNFKEIMEGVWSLILPDLQQMRLRGIPAVQTARQGPSWLPFSD